MFISLSQNLLIDQSRVSSCWIAQNVSLSFHSFFSSINRKQVIFRSHRMFLSPFSGSSRRQCEGKSFHDLIWLNVPLSFAGCFHAQLDGQSFFNLDEFSLSWSGRSHRQSSGKLLPHMTEFSSFFFRMFSPWERRTNVVQSIRIRLVSSTCFHRQNKGKSFFSPNEFRSFHFRILAHSILFWFESFFTFPFRSRS